jgi:hypothetical protein
VGVEEGGCGCGGADTVGISENPVGENGNAPMHLGFVGGFLSGLCHCCSQKKQLIRNERK